MLKGKKVVLRPVKRTDVRYFLKWFNDPEVIQYLTLYLPMLESSEEKWIEGLSARKDDVVFVIDAVESKRGRKTIGNCGLQGIDNKDQKATFGIAIGNKNFWSNGYGTEAARLLIDYGFKELNLRRITSYVYEFNLRSKNMHLSLGFQEEGCYRKDVYKNGRFWNKIILGLLREEWEERKAKTSKQPV